MLMQMLAQEVYPQRIQVNAIPSDAIATNINREETQGAPTRSCWSRGKRPSTVEWLTIR